MTAPGISIALLTRNGMATLPQLLDAVTAQSIDAEVELVVVDTASDDGSAELLADHATTLLRIQPADFNHGLTRNLALEHCRGELAVLLVQDAIPDSEHWLARLTAPFAHDPLLAGTMARQRPTAEASRLTRWALERWVLAQEEPFVHALHDPATWTDLEPMERFTLSVFDNVCSCVRRSVWKEYRFAPTAIAEDVEWGRDVLLGGYRLQYVPEAAVIHSHQRGCRYELERTYLVHHRLFELTGIRTVPDLNALLRAVARSFGEHLRVLRQGAGPKPGLREWRRALGLAAAWPLGQYLGGRAAARGVHYWRPRGI